MLRNVTSACAVVWRRRGKYVPDLVADILAGKINPGRVFDFETDLDHIVDGYEAMDSRRAIKSLVRVASPAT